MGNQGIDDCYAVEMFEVLTVCGVDSMHVVIQHSGHEEIVEDRVGSWAMFLYKLYYGIYSFRDRSNNAYARALFIKFDQFLRLHGG